MNQPADNQTRLSRVENRLNRLEELALENRAIADHLGLTYEKPPGTQAD